MPTMKARHLHNLSGNTLLNENENLICQRPYCNNYFIFKRNA
jgi:hypothetical protein